MGIKILPMEVFGGSMEASAENGSRDREGI